MAEGQTSVPTGTLSRFASGVRSTLAPFTKTPSLPMGG